MIARLDRHWVALTALAVAAAWLTRNDTPADLAQFARLGGAVSSGRFSTAYATPWDQTGPLQLLASRVLMFGGANNHPALPMIIGVDVAIVLLVRAAFATAAGAKRSGVELGIGALVLLWLAPGGLWDAHPIEIIVAMFWLAAGRGLIRGQTLIPALWLGLAGAIAPWAILALPTTLLAPDFGRAARSASAAIIVSVAAYLPFALTGHFELFSHVWQIEPTSLVHFLLPDQAHFGWGLRMVQAALAAGACGVVAFRGRGKSDAIWIAPLTCVVVRILLDPGPLDYYWLPAGALFIGGVAMIGITRTRAQLVGIVALAYLTYAATVSANVQVFACAGCLVAIALILPIRLPQPMGRHETVSVGQAQIGQP